MLLDRTLRDAAALRCDASVSLTGCDPSGASELSRLLTAAASQIMHLSIDRAYAALHANVNLPLALSALCAACMDAR